MQEIELLNSVYQVSQMGRDAIMQMIKIAEDTTFRSALETQLTEYQNLFDTAQSMLAEHGTTPKDISTMSKTAASVSTKMKTMSDKTPSNMADLMITGSTMGIVEITKSIHRFDGSEQPVLDLANKLLETERRNVDDMTRFL